MAKFSLFGARVQRTQELEDAIRASLPLLVRMKELCRAAGAIEALGLADDMIIAMNDALEGR